MASRRKERGSRLLLSSRKRTAYPTPPCHPIATSCRLPIPYSYLYPIATCTRLTRLPLLQRALATTQSASWMNRVTSKAPERPD